MEAIGVRWTNACFPSWPSRFSRGISVASIVYRLCPNAASEVLNDCALALDWLIEKRQICNCRCTLTLWRVIRRAGHLAVSMLARERSSYIAGLRAVASLSGLFELTPLDCSMKSGFAA